MFAKAVFLISFITCSTNAAYLKYPYGAEAVSPYIKYPYGAEAGVATPIYEVPLAHGQAAYGYPKYGYGYEGEGDHYAYPKYQYSYGVSDPHTGDHKTQEEIRDGDVVKGSYSLAEPDGTIRTVHYTADDLNGFNAVVSKEGHAVHPVPVVYEKGYVAAPQSYYTVPKAYLGAAGGYVAAPKAYAGLYGHY